MLAVVARRHIHLHSVAATAFSITLVIDDSLEMMTADESTTSDQTTQPQAIKSTPSEKSGSTEKAKSFRMLVAELVNAVEGIDLREKDFICEENRRNRILGQRRTHEW